MPPRIPTRGASRLSVKDFASGAGLVAARAAGAAAFSAAAGLTAGALAQLGGSLYRSPSDLSAYGTNNIFPNDLSTTHYIGFSFHEYQRRSIYNRVQLAARGHIKLPLPTSLVDNQQVQYSQEGTNVIVGAALDAASRGGNLSFGGAAAAAGAAAVQAGAAAVGTNAGQLGSLAGVAINPFLAVLFKSPSFKKHSFAWKLSPNNSNESEVLYRIINKFKYHMLPDISNNSGGVVLSYPDIVQVNLYPNDKYLYKFKPCVIESVSVNFSPNVTPAFYKDTGAPIEVTITVNLLEIEYWLRRDHQFVT